jgi:hypothetical protein
MVDFKKININSSKENRQPEEKSVGEENPQLAYGNTGHQESGFKFRLKNKLKLKKPKKKMTKKKKIIVFCMLGIFVLAAAIISSLVFFTLPVVTELKQTRNSGLEAYQAIKNQDLVLADEKLKQTKDSFVAAREKFSRLSWAKLIPGLKIYIEDGSHAFTAGENGLEAGLILIESVTPYADVLGFKGEGSFSGGTTEDRIAKIIETLEKVTPKIDEAIGHLDQMQLSLQEIDPSHYPESFRGMAIREQITQSKDQVDNAVTQVKEAQPAIKVLPQVLGYPDPTNYLLIMQNDGELRPTGGFMTAYAILEIKSGKIEALKSDDIYSLDAKFKEKVKAPEVIQKYLFASDLNTGIVPYWYIRDMNLSPDFKVSMENFKKYYDEIPGEPEVDGIIAIDTKVLKDLITVLGPVEVPGFGTYTMEKDPRCHDIPQVVCEIEHIVDTPIPGIKRGRKDILGPIMKTLLSKIFDAPSEIWPSIFKLGMEEINQKHVLFYFDEQEKQNAAEKMNAAGRIVDFSPDYFHVNDANFGGAKSNLFVDHEVEQEIIVNEDMTIEKTVTLTYTNPEPMDDCNLERATGLCLNGILRNYFRIYVPKGSTLIEGIGSEVEIETKEDLDKTMFDGFFELRGDGGKAKVVLTYRLPFKYDEIDDYQMLIQKQPGTDNHKYIVHLGEETKEFELLTDTKLTF